MKLALLRHAVTDWNLEKRVQGRIDQPLSATGRQQFQGLAIPPKFATYHWYCSPLRRARETAGLLGLTAIDIEAALIEMSWGDWEGEILKPLRKRLGDEMRDNERRGDRLLPAARGKPTPGPGPAATLVAANRRVKAGYCGSSAQGYNSLYLCACLRLGHVR